MLRGRGARRPSSTAGSLRPGGGSRLGSIDAIHRWLLVVAKVLRRSRSRIQAWRTLRPSKMRRKARLLRFLRRRGQSWTALVVSCHDASEQIARAMAD